jgi:hypothetical protein
MEDSETLKTAEKRISGLGLPAPRTPSMSSGELSWPKNVADLSSEELAEHLTWWSSWQSYTLYHLARAETNYAVYSKELSIESQKALFNSSGDYSNVTTQKAAVAQIPAIARMEQRVLEAEAIKKMLQSMVKGYEIKYTTISREISRRNSEYNNGGGV